MIIKQASIYSYVVCAVMVVLSAKPCQGQDVRAITLPSKDVTLPFLRPGRIAKVMV